MILWLLMQEAVLAERRGVLSGSSCRKFSGVQAHQKESKNSSRTKEVLGSHCIQRYPQPLPEGEIIKSLLVWFLFACFLRSSVRKPRCLGDQPKLVRLFQSFSQDFFCDAGQSFSNFLASPKRGIKMFPFFHKGSGSSVVMTRRVFLNNFCLLGATRDKCSWCKAVRGSCTDRPSFLSSI